MNIKDKILGRRISGIFNALNILLGLFCIIYYSINANRVNEFNKAVDFYLGILLMLMLYWPLCAVGFTYLQIM